MDRKNHQTDTDETSSECFIKPFKFPPPPRLCICNTSKTVSYNSDSSASDGTLLRMRKRNRKKFIKHLPPIGVFWDIENCQVPKNKSASSIVQKIRELFFDGYREAEFIVVCDVKKENAQMIQDLHDAQINLIHVSSTSKNAADEKLRQSLRRYGEIYSAPSAVVLISGDVNFAGDLSDLRYRKKIQIILIHNSNAADALVSLANKSYAYGSFTENLPLLKTRISSQYEILIENLPVNCGLKKLRNRLNRLSDNCGGKVVNVDSKLGTAVLVFGSYNFAIRAQRRLRGEDVYGFKIRLSNPTNVGDLPNQIFTPRPSKSVEGTGQSSGYCSQDGGNYYPNHQNNSWDSRKNLQEQDNFFIPIKSSNQSHRSQMDNSIGAWGVSNTNRSKSNPTFTYKEEDYQIMSTYKSIELLITNLDPTPNLKSVLQNLMEEYVVVVSLNVTYMKDNPIASVRVRSHQDAQYLISKLHGYKVGNKRIIFSYVQSDDIDPDCLKDGVVSVLTESPGNRLPLPHLITLVQTRFNIKPSEDDLNKLTDTIRIEDINNQTTITLIPEVLSPNVEINNSSSPYCQIHHHLFEFEYESFDLPNVNINLQEFSHKVYTLLKLHNEVLPLLSFPICYKSIFGGEIPEDNDGVPLEHLISCVGGVFISLEGVKRNIKYLKRSNQLKKDDFNGGENKKFGILTQEIFEILSTTENYQLNLSKFIPMYHQKFHHQCKLSYYGFSKLIDLLQSPFLSRFIQVIGNGDNRVITLTHSAQIDRFTRDIFKVFKSENNPIKIIEFPSIYERVMKRPFNIFEYGLCTLQDMLNEIIKNSKLGNVSLIELSSIYLNDFGYPICNNEEILLGVLQKLTDYVDVLIGNVGMMVLSSDEIFNEISNDIIRIWSLLLEPPHQLMINDFIRYYKKKFNAFIFVDRLKKLKDIILMEDNKEIIRLTPFYVLASEIYHVLFQSGGKIRLGDLQIAYKKIYDKKIDYENFDVDGLDDLIGKMDFAFIVETIYVSLKHSLNAYGIPLPMHSDSIMEKSENEGGIVWPSIPPCSMWNQYEPAKPDTPPENVRRLNRIASKEVVAWKSLSPMPNLQPIYPLSISSPHPAEVPMPDKLLEKDKSIDSSGQIRSKSHSETDSSVEKEKRTGAKPKVLSTGKKSQLKFD